MSTPTTVRLDKNTMARLDILGKKLDRSRAWLIKEAISQYLEREERRFRGVDEGIQEMRQGYVFDQSEVEAHFVKKGFPNAVR